VKETHESSNSKISGSGSLATAASPDVSFLTEVLEEATSPTRFLFFSKPLSSVLAVGGNCYSVMAPGNMLWRIMIVGADVLVRGE
jgi:hypothetical protein